MEFVPFVTLETLANTKALDRMFHGMEGSGGKRGSGRLHFLGTNCRLWCLMFHL